MTPEQKFRAVAPKWMKLLRQDFSLSIDDAAAIFGNIGHECAGFTKLQEMKPVVAGSRGGYGWPQWTGGRREAYEAYCARNNLNPASEEANYKYLFVELSGIEGSEGGAIAKVKKEKTLYLKVVAFEKAFLRAGVKHYESRMIWAERARHAYLSVYGDDKTETRNVSVTTRFQDWLVKLALGRLHSKLKDTGMLSFLDGYKTYIATGLLILVAAAQLVGIDTPVVPEGGELQTIWGAVIAIFMRRGLKTGV